MYVLKQKEGSCVHYNIVDSLSDAVAELSCEQAYLFTLEIEECEDASMIIAACNTLEEAGDYHNLYDIIRSLSTQEPEIEIKVEED